MAQVLCRGVIDHATVAASVSWGVIAEDPVQCMVKV